MIRKPQPKLKPKPEPEPKAKTKPELKAEPLPGSPIQAISCFCGVWPLLILTQHLTRVVGYLGAPTTYTPSGGVAASIRATCATLDSSHCSGNIALHAPLAKASIQANFFLAKMQLTWTNPNIIATVQRQQQIQQRATSLKNCVLLINTKNLARVAPFPPFLPFSLTLFFPCAALGFWSIFGKYLREAIGNLHCHPAKRTERDLSVSDMTICNCRTVKSKRLQNPQSEKERQGVERERDGF